jgi:hypothetical protein
LVAAMQTEALPLVTRFQLVEAAADESMSVLLFPFWFRIQNLETDEQLLVDVSC